MSIKKAYLIFSFFTVTVIALLYGIDPQWFARTFLDMPELDKNIAHIFRAVMCLYIALGLFWLYAAFVERYRNVALIILMLFAGGLVTGRLISLFNEGQPAPLLVLYIVMEFLFVPITFWIYKLKE